MMSGVVLALALALDLPLTEGRFVPASAAESGGAASAGTSAPASHAAGEIPLACAGVSFVVSTGSSSGECLAQPGGLALCLDAQSSSASARCGTGCLGTNGTGSCMLADEERIGGSFTLACADGARYLLRTRTGKGRCEATGPGSSLRASCADGKSHGVEASCAEGCGKVRGYSSCARYKREGDTLAR